MRADEMSPKQLEEHMRSGGRMQTANGQLRLVPIPNEERYALLNDSGNGGEYVVDRPARALDYMDQLGGLAAWETVEAT